VPPALLAHDYECESRQVHLEQKESNTWLAKLIFEFNLA
jgi:hypothetical protein